MMGYKEGKYRIEQFFKAEVFEECKERVAKENSRMLYFLNTGIAVFSLVMCIYTAVRESGRASYSNTYVLFFLASIFILFVTKLIVSKNIELSFPVIVMDYLVLVSNFTFVSIFGRPDAYVTSCYILTGLAFCFLIKPVRIILLQITAMIILNVSMYLYRPKIYAEGDFLNSVVLTGASIFLGCAVLRFRMDSLKMLDEKDKALKVTLLYQNVLDETQTAVYVRDFYTYEVLYLNRKADELFCDGEGRAEGICYELLYGRTSICEECPVGQLKNEDIWERELCLGGRYYQTKGKIIDWCGREAYVEYLTDITDTKKFSEQMRIANENLQKKYQDELLYREKAVSEDVLSTSRLNLTRRLVEEMRVGKKEGYEKKYRYTVDFASRISAYTRELWISDAQNRRLSPQGLLEQFENGETRLSEEFMAELADGRPVWTRVEVSMVRRPENSEVIAFLYNKDITQGKKLKHILERMMSFEYDEIYTVDGVNERFGAVVTGQYAMDDQILEGSYDEELACLISRAVSDVDRERIRQDLCLENIRRCLEREQTYVIEVSLKSKNGRARLKRIRCMYLNEVMGMFLITLSDIDDVVKEEKQKQERLEQALQMAEEANVAKTGFLASMSHEIRTPMNAIIGLSSMIKDEASDCDLVMDYAQKLGSASRYLLSLLNDILDMSRIESGNISMVHQPFEGDRFWENVNMLANAQAVPASIRYIFERKEKVSSIYIGDETRLEQIMINLINNAIKFTSGGGIVRVIVTEKEESEGRAKMIATVEDNGIGISKDFLPRVFGTFTQQHEGGTTSYGGSGLGLSIARNFARMMDGDITVESIREIGTKFTVSVRLDIDKAKQPALEQGRRHVDFTGKRVLLVEDHPLNTIVATKLLSKKGFEVVHAENGQEAVLQFCQSGPGYYDIILMDIRMPVMDGIEATKQLRALEREDAGTIPIIAMTANAYDEDRRKTKEAGMNAHLAKPIEPQQFFEILDDFIQKK